MSGILIESSKLDTDEDMLNFLTQFRRQLYTTIDRLMTSEPEYIIMGNCHRITYLYSTT